MSSACTSTSPLLLLPSLLLLQLTWPGPGRSAATIAPTAENCSSPATEACIKVLVEEELIPLQESLGNGSNLLNSTHQQFVEGVWAAFRRSAEEAMIVSTGRELTDVGRTLSRLHVTWNSSYHKGNELMDSLTFTEVNVEGSVGLLEEEVAVLQKHMELNASRADGLFLHSLDLLESVQGYISQLNSNQKDLNVATPQLLNIVARLQESLDSSQGQSAAAEALGSASGAVLERVSEQLKLEERARQTALRALSEVLSIGEDMGRLSIALEEVNRSVEVGKDQQTSAREIEEDILKEVDEMVELSSGVELLLASVVRLAGAANVTNSAATELVQNVSELVRESSRIMAGYEVFRERLQSLVAGADAGIFHALDLSQLAHSIRERGEMFLRREFADEFGRLSVINTTVSRAVALVPGALPNHTESVRELVGSAAEDATIRGRLLVETAGNITTPSLFEPKAQLWNGSLQYDRVRHSYLNTVQQVSSFEVDQTTVEGELSQIMRSLSVIQSSAVRVNKTTRGVSFLIGGIDFESIASETNRTTSDASHTLNLVAANTSEVGGDLTQLEGALQNLSRSVRERSGNQSALNDSLSWMASLVSATFMFIDQTDYPLELGGENATVLTLRPEQLMSPLVSGEFRSISLHFSPSSSNISNSVILHLLSTTRQQVRTELLVEVVEGHVRVLLRTVSARGRVFSLTLSIPDTTVQPHRTYSLFISRTVVNVHVELTELWSSVVFRVDREASSRLSSAFSSSSFLSTASLLIGGGSPRFQDGPRFSGCLGGVEINSAHLNLWSLAVSSGNSNLCPCSGNYSAAAREGKVHLSLGEGRFAQQWVNGSFLPAVVEFQTQLPNGLLLYTHSPSSQLELNSFSVYLDRGRIEVRVRAGRRQRTLTSSHTYHNGVLHVARVELEGSSRLVLRTKAELVRKRLQMVPVASLSTYSELLVGGVGERVRQMEGVDQSNFTGCISVYSLGSLPKVPQCYEREIINCSFCSSHQTALSAEFYGASHAVFPAFVATTHLDISLRFRTYFGDGLMLFIGSAAKGMWLALVLEGGRFSLLFQAGANSPFSLSRGSNLNDSSLHTVTVIRSGFSLSMMVDQSVFESPFGFALFFPSGLFPTDLFVGGVPHSHTDLLYAGTTWDGFKGQLEEIRVNGRALDFSENLAAAAVTVVGGDDSEGTRGQNGCDFRFSGLASYAEFDIGRFPDNFSLGFQLNAESGSGLLFYVFSRRRQDKMAIQLHNNTLQLFVQDTRGDQLAVSLPQEVSLREWHDVRVSQQGGNMTLTLDGDLKQQALLVLPSPLRTTSPLYIGGLPTDQRIPTSSGVVRDHFAGCLRSHHLSLSTNRRGVETGSCETQS